jgi:cysteine-rich repeat protein
MGDFNVTEEKNIIVKAVDAVVEFFVDLFSFDLSPGGNCGDGRLDNAIIILDNADSSGITKVGEWLSSTYTSGYYGEDYIHDSNTLKGQKSVTYTYPMTGAAKIYVLYAASSNRASNVPIDIYHNGGVNTSIVNQRTGGGVWLYLGTFTFTNEFKLVIRTDNTDGGVIADAVKILRQDFVNEECDDANQNNGDGCSSICKKEYPYIVNAVDLTFAEGYPTYFDFNVQENTTHCFKIDNNNFKINCNGTFTNVTNLAIGTYVVNISVNDSYQRISSKIINVNIVPRKTALEMKIQRDRVLAYLKYLPYKTEKKIMSGQTAQVSFGNTVTSDEPFWEIYRNSGKWPAIMSASYRQDFSSRPRVPYPDANMYLIQHTHRGGLVQIHIPLSHPISDGNWGIDPDNIVNITELLRPGGLGHDRFIADLNEVAKGLQELQDNGAVVFMKAYHEMKLETFAWWCSQTPSDYKLLYAYTKNYLENEKGLKNLIWLYSPIMEATCDSHYPGDENIDVMGPQLYTSVTPSNDCYNSLLSHNKPIVWAEFGPSPATAFTFDTTQLLGWIKRRMPKMGYFLFWSGTEDKGWGMNRQLNYKALLGDSWVINRDDLPNFASGEDSLKPIFIDLTGQTLIAGNSLNYKIETLDDEGVVCFSLNDTINFKIDCLGNLQNNRALEEGVYFINVTIWDNSNNRNSEIMYVNVVDPRNFKNDFSIIKESSNMNGVQLFFKPREGIDKYLILRSDKLGWASGAYQLENSSGYFHTRNNHKQGDLTLNITSNNTGIELGEEVIFSLYPDEVYFIIGIDRAKKTITLDRPIIRDMPKSSSMTAEKYINVKNTNGLVPGCEFSQGLRDPVTRVKRVINKTKLELEYPLAEAFSTANYWPRFFGCWIEDYSNYINVSEVSNAGVYVDKNLALEKDYFYVIAYMKNGEIVEYSIPVNIRLTSNGILYDAAVASSGGYAWKAEQGASDVPGIIDGNDESSAVRLQFNNPDIVTSGERNIGFTRINLDKKVDISMIEIIQRNASNRQKASEVMFGFDDGSFLTFDLENNESIIREQVDEKKKYSIYFNKNSSYVSVYIQNLTAQGFNYLEWYKVGVYTDKQIFNPATNPIELNNTEFEIDFSKVDGKLTTMFGTDEIYDNSEGVELGWMLNALNYTKDIFNIYRLQTGDGWPHCDGQDILKVGELDQDMNSTDKKVKIRNADLYNIKKVQRGSVLRIDQEMMKANYNSNETQVNIYLRGAGRGDEITYINSHKKGTPIYVYSSTTGCAISKTIPPFETEIIKDAYLVSSNKITAVDQSVPMNDVATRYAILYDVPMVRGDFNVGDVISVGETFKVLAVDKSNSSRQLLTLQRGYDGFTFSSQQASGRFPDVKKYTNFELYYRGYKNNPADYNDYNWTYIDEWLHRVIVEQEGVPWFIIWSAGPGKTYRGKVGAIENLPEGVPYEGNNINSVLVDYDNSLNNDTDWWYLGNRQWGWSQVNILSGDAAGKVFYVARNTADRLRLVANKDELGKASPQYADLVAEGVKPGDFYKITGDDSPQREYWQYNSDVAYRIAKYTIDNYGEYLDGKPIYLEFFLEPNLDTYGNWEWDAYIDSYNIFAKTIKEGREDLGKGLPSDRVKIGGLALAGGLNPGNRIPGTPSGDYGMELDFIKRVNYVDFISHHRYYEGMRTQKRENSYQYWLIRNYAKKYGKNITIIDSEDSVATAGGTGKEQARHSSEYGIPYWQSNFINSYYGDYGEMGRLDFILQFRQYYSNPTGLGMAITGSNFTTPPSPYGRLDAVYWPIKMYRDHTSEDYYHPDSLATVTKGADKYGWTETMGTIHGVTGQKHIHLVNKKGEKMHVNLTLFGVSQAEKDNAVMYSVIGAGERRTIGDGYFAFNYDELGGYNGEGVIIEEPVNDFSNIILEPNSASVIALGEDLETCSEQGGNNCGDNQNCNGLLTPSKDTTKCCIGTCVDKPSCIDGDDDGFFAQGGVCGEKDCNDLSIFINPSAEEVCNDNVDNNCNGFIDCKDSDCSENENCTSIHCIDADRDGLKDFNDSPGEANYCPDGKDKCIQINFNFSQFKPNLVDYNLSYEDSLDLRNISNVRIEKNKIARIIFKDRIRMIGVNETGCFVRLNLTRKIEISPRRIVVNANETSELNNPASLIFENISLSRPIILRDSSYCFDCSYVYNKTSGILEVNVSGFSVYEVVEQCGDGIQDGDETGVDCGGSCSACSTSPPPGSPGGPGGPGTPQRINDTNDSLIIYNPNLGNLNEGSANKVESSSEIDDVKKTYYTSIGIFILLLIIGIVLVLMFIIYRIIEMRRTKVHIKKNLSQS